MWRKMLIHSQRTNPPKALKIFQYQYRGSYVFDSEQRKIRQMIFGEQELY